MARTELVKAGLELLHRQAAEERMARGVEEFHHGQEPPPSPFVRRSRHRPAGDDTTVPGTVGDVLIAETVRHRVDEPGESLPLEGLIAELGLDPARFD